MPIMNEAGVIGASSESLYAIKEAKKRGIHVIAIDGSEHAPGLTASDEGHVVDIRNYETKEDEEGNFDIVIDHDGNFKRVFGVNARPNALTTEEIRNNSKLSEVCFFDEYINICKEHNMVPIGYTNML